MKKALAVILTSSLFIAGCASTEMKEDKPMEMMGSAVVTQAHADLDAAVAMGAEWRLIDKATGSKAVNLSKLMKVVDEKAKAGETEEADRIAARISEASKIAMDQHKRYAGATPYYN